MRIWITGSAGFLGVRLVRAFIAAGHEVVGVSRRACPFASRSVSLDLASDGVADRLRELGRRVGSPDAVVHAAGLKPGPHSLAEYVKSNVLTTSNLLDALGESPPRQLVYTSTLSVYGRPDTNPVKETHPARGNFPYAIVKRCSEKLLETFQGRMQVIIFRLPSVYGAGQPDSFVDGLARLAIRNQRIELYAGGKVVRDALHIHDVVSAVVGCVITPPRVRYCCMNLGCGEPITALEYAEALVEALGSSSTLVPVDRASPNRFDLYADIEEARRLIGFCPTGLMRSIRMYADELRSQP